MKRSTAALICICAFAAASLRGQEPAFGMRMHVINIGQGDSILLEFKNHAVLVDTGGEDTTDDGRYQGFLINYLEDFFARRTDLQRSLYGVVLSHPHIDHTKFLLPVMDNFNVENLIEGGGTIKNTQVRSIIRQARQRLTSGARISVRYNTVNSAKVRTWADLIEADSGATVQFLSGKRYCSNVNNDSLVMRVQFGTRSFLLTGDSERDDEPPNNCGGLIGYLLAKPALKAQLDVDVYKVGHHGSYNGVTDSFLEKITPEFSVISAGKYDDKQPGNFHAFQFGHPRGDGTNPNRDAFLKIVNATRGSRPAAQVYYLTHASGSKTAFTLSKAVYCTCWDDNIIFEVNPAGDTITVSTVASP